MCSCFKSGLVLHSSSESKRRQGQQRRQEESGSFSMSVSAQIREFTVRVVHAGGRIEMYQRAIPVSVLVHKYPGMCIVRPTVFRRPHDSLLSDDDILLPGNKYLVIRRTTVEKLKSRHRQAMKVGQATVLEAQESVCSSTDFYVSKDRWSILSKQQVKEKREFVPPIQRPRLRKEPDWEPSLTSIQEVSP